MKLPNPTVVTLLAAVALFSLATPRTTADDAATGGEGDAPRHRLRLYNTHTGERVDVVYRVGDRYLPHATRRLENHLRDHRSGQVASFDPTLFDLLADLAAAVDRPGGEFQVISGFRAPQTNEMLRSRSSGVAKKSMHTEARAIDIRMSGVETARLRDVALSLARGGVGYYESSDFIHVDTGRVRRW